MSDYIKFTPTGTAVAPSFMESHTGTLTQIPFEVYDSVPTIKVKALTERISRSTIPNSINYNTSTKVITTNNIVEDNPSSIDNFIPIIGTDGNNHYYLVNYDTLQSLGYNSSNINIRLVRKDHDKGGAMEQRYKRIGGIAYHRPRLVAHLGGEQYSYKLAASKSGAGRYTVTISSTGELTNFLYQCEHCPTRKGATDGYYTWFGIIIFPNSNGGFSSSSKHASLVSSNCLVYRSSYDGQSEDGLYGLVDTWVHDSVAF